MKYYTVSETPLAYHNFIRFFVLPVCILSLAAGSVVAFAAASKGLYAYFDAGLLIVVLALYVVCFIGCLKWKPYAWYTMMAILVLTPLDRLAEFINTVLTSPHDFPMSLLTFLLSVLLAIPVFVYYKKRKPLFIHDMPVPIGDDGSGETGRGGAFADFAPPDNGNLEYRRPVRARYCRRCGEPLPSEDSRFCRMCGTEVAMPADYADTWDSFTQPR